MYVLTSIALPAFDPGMFMSMLPQLSRLAYVMIYNIPVSQRIWALDLVQTRGGPNPLGHRDNIMIYAAPLQENNALVTGNPHTHTHTPGKHGA